VKRQCLTRKTTVATPSEPSDQSAPHALSLGACARSTAATRPRRNAVVPNGEDANQCASPFSLTSSRPSG
jgi:hypothetical protein